MGISIVSGSKVDYKEGDPVNYIQSQARGITLEIEGVHESHVSILWNCGLWAHHVGKKYEEG